MLERILQEIEAKGNIQFSSYTKPLIAVEDVVKIIRAHADDNQIGELRGSGSMAAEKYKLHIREMIEKMDEKDLEKVYAFVHKRFVNRPIESVGEGGREK